MHIRHTGIQAHMSNLESLSINNTLRRSCYSVACCLIYLGILVLIAEVLSRSLGDDPELTRKIVHIGSGNVILLAWWLNISRSIIVSAAVIAAAISPITSYLVPILPSIESVGRKSFGTLFYAISMGVLTGCFWQDYPQYAVIVFWSWHGVMV